MYEVERKVRVAHTAIRPALADSPAIHESTVRQRDIYFDHPTRSFASTDEALRIREIVVVEDEGDGTAQLTYKGPRLTGEAKTRKELESGIDDADQLQAILQALGFEPVATVEKRREIYRLDDYEISLDTVEDLGEFLEVETQSDRDDVEAADVRAEEILGSLGIDPAESISTSYLELILAETPE